MQDGPDFVLRAADDKSFARIFESDDLICSKWSL
jgi:hypothetical protein